MRLTLDQIRPVCIGNEAIEILVKVMRHNYKTFTIVCQFDRFDLVLSL